MKKIIKWIIVIFLLWIIIFTINLKLTKNQHKPILCIKIPNIWPDSRSSVYYGLGYKIYYFFVWEDFEYEGSRYGNVIYFHMTPWFTKYEEVWKKVKYDTQANQIKQSLNQ